MIYAIEIGYVAVIVLVVSGWHLLLHLLANFDIRRSTHWQ